MQTTPLTKIIFLSALLALGFLLIILSSALYSNWYPLYVVLVFLLAPLPNLLFRPNEYDDFLGDGSSNGAGDFSKFVTGSLVTSGVLIPLVFKHTALINDNAMWMSLCGGGAIYVSIILFVGFFENKQDEFSL